MPIGLLNTYSTHNLGDAAIYAALASMAPDHSVTGNLREQSTTKINGLTIDNPQLQCQVFVGVGGDIFNNARPKLITRRFLENLSELNRKPKSTMLFGQSIPRSCRGLSFHLLSRTLRKLSFVCIRDVESYQRLTQNRVKVELSYDTAFALPTQIASHKAAQAAYDKLGLIPEKTIIISVRNESSMYVDNKGDVQLKKLAQLLHARGHQLAVLIQADGDASDSDWGLARQITELVPSCKILNPFETETDLEPWSLMTAMFGLARAVVAVRYHAAILSLIEGRKPYVLHYSNKGADLCNRLNLPGSVFGVQSPETLIGEIENCAESAFDPAPMRKHVRDCFAVGLQACAK